MIKNNKYDVIIIGSGAAGMMSAIIAAEYGRKVLIFDKNEKLGRKLRITGKGRCNLCNNTSNDEIMANTITNARFLYSSLRNFSAEDLMNFFESRGVKLKTERGNRVYPESNNANDIANLLENAMFENNVELLRQTVEKVVAENGKIKSVISGGEEFFAESVLIATGGASYKATGSTGDGYKFAKSFGHTVVSPKSSLVGMCSLDEFLPELQGLSLKNTGLKLYKNEKVIYEDFGELLFAHFGISGPIVLSASTKIRDKENYKVTLDLKPALTKEQLDKKFIRAFEEYHNKNFDNYLPELLPRKLIPVIRKMSGIDGDTKCHSVTKEQRLKLIEVLKNFTVNITELRPINEAIVTAGGVNVKEVNPKTMESKIIEGLFFAGEVLDLDAYTGGFNLQIAFSTAYTAGTNL
ncbi:MAG: NAD(P)/FAD-dependent oxidoreductase [Clostridia bacterium]